jgi:hypothetical protein
MNSPFLTTVIPESNRECNALYKNQSVVVQFISRPNAVPW